jgi:hypothetical protein
VISSTGHISNQVDLLIFDKLNSPKLMSIDDIQYFPIESVYGVIEVKSNIDSKDTLFDAFKKINTSFFAASLPPQRHPWDIIVK